MKLCTQQNWCATGTCVSVTPISLGSGYTWLGYLPQSNLPINTALSGCVPAPVDNDRFNGQTSFATYNSGQWIGSLSTLQKGAGYIIKVTNATVLTYPSSSPSLGIQSGDPTPVLNSPTGDKPGTNHQYNMQIIGELMLPDGTVTANEQDVVYAYHGAECRGMINPMPAVGGKLFITIGSDVPSGEEITFRYYSAANNTVYNVVEMVGFESNNAIGTMIQPMVFHVGGVTGIQVHSSDNWLLAGEVYPNPFDETATLSFTIKRSGRMEGRIINGFGKMIQIPVDKEMEAGSYNLVLNGRELPPGLYTLILTYSNGNARQNVIKKLIIQ